MATRIRTLNFLPDVFKTQTNSQFLQATLDQLVAQPNTMRIEGYIGSKFGYGINAKDYYVVEPTKVRTDYQLDPGVVFLKDNQETAKDFISYPGIIDALNLEGGVTNNNNRLFNNQFYSWDSFTNLDKIINFNQYYWLPTGPERVTVATETVFSTNSYVVTDAPNGYIIAPENQVGSMNPILTLLRGGTYTFSVNQPTQFWIQGEPGPTGYSPTQPNVQTRDVLGVTNNGASAGVVTFTVPTKDAQAEYTNLPGTNTVDVVSTLPFDSINGKLLSEVVNIDGITSLNGLTLMFYNTGVVNEAGYVSKFYDTTGYDEDGGSYYDESMYPGSSIDNNNFEGGYYTNVSGTFYTITYVGDPSNPTIRLVDGAGIPTNQKITVNYGTQWISRSFFRNIAGTIELIPYLSAILDTLYYQDGTNENKVGIIKLIDSNTTNTLNIETEILGKAQYTASNGVVFTNGLKVVFQGDIYPTSYRNIPFYVEGVGTAIELIPESETVVPELFTEGTYTPFDSLPYDIGNFDVTLYIPVTPDYITIARNSIDKNAWSRSNRWFHIDVINATAQYNQDPSYVTSAATAENKAKRPIIEFYPNLRLFNSGIIGKAPVDFMDFRSSDALAQVSGHYNYYPDVAAYTAYNSVITGVSGTPTLSGITETKASTNVVVCTDTSSLFVNDKIVFDDNIGGIIAGDTYYVKSINSTTTFTVSVEKNGDTESLTNDTVATSATITPQSTNIVVQNSGLVGSLQLGQYVVDTYESTTQDSILPTNSFVSAIEESTTTTTITISWNSTSAVTIPTMTDACLNTTDTTVDNYAIFDGARIVFAADANLSVRNKIYVARMSSVAGSIPVITLTEAPDGAVLVDDQTVAYRGYNYQGKDFHFDGIDWVLGQQKTTVNQPPKFDIFDKNGISLSNTDVYVGSSFTGSTLFSYGLGTGSDDVILGFPVRYSSVDNIGDISFDVSLNSDTFDYVSGTNPITENVNVGYVYNYSARENYVRQLGWQTAVSPSVQYQVFSFDYDVTNPTSTFTCDIAAVDPTTTNWPVVQVFINNQYQDPSNYTVTVTDNTTVINMTVDSLVDTVVQVLVISDQVSSTAYYQIPWNLNNNPLNEDITVVNVGDIRGQYQSIFYNNPNTTGDVFGSNNYRDLGNMVPWGNKIIQNSASLVLPGAFLRQQNHNLFDALQYNSQRYITFKTLLVDTVNNADYTIHLTPSQMLDDALDQMSSYKTDSEPFFWSDMLPSKAAYITNTYSFANSLDVSIYPLSRVYDFTTANYYGVLVYLTRTTDGLTTVTQLVINNDYTVSTDSPSLTIQTDLLPGDVITIKEYNQTYGSYCPNTPTKLGLYPSTVPTVVLDSSYTVPTYFIVGHDGSFNKLYGSYNETTGQLQDFRDKVLLEFETRVYNNLKVVNVIPVQEYEVLPGFFRNTDYSYAEILEIYSENFLNWVGQNRLDYKRQVFNKGDQYTYNYRNSGNKIDRAPIQQGYWRGMYQYFYDTSTPNVTPWEMLGYKNMPTWWETRYGPAPYTSDNLVLWGDLSEGYDWNNGVPVTLEQYKRPGLLSVLPVDTAGNLVPPLTSIVGNYNNNTFQRDWQVGDGAPVEFSYRRSSSWPFDLMKILALTKPAEFFSLAVDVDHYKYNAEFNQYLVNDRSHLVLSDIDVYGSGTAVTSYINWIIDYEKQVGVDATTQIQNLLNTLDVRLVYRLAGFSDKDLLKFYVEKGTPNSRNASLLIPDESYAVLLYDNQPFDQITFSGVVIQITPNGYKVYGNSQNTAYFKIIKPKINGNYNSIVIEDVTVQVPNDFYDDTVTIPYGTEFYTPQEVAVFLAGYGRYLESQGMIFNQIENGIEITWNQMVAEFLYWSQMGWEVGSIATVNPAAGRILIDKDSTIVQPLTLARHNFILNQNLFPIDINNLSVVRENTAFAVEPLNQGDTLSYGQFNVSNFEHGIVFDNTTLFGDVIYNLVTGLRQIRIITRGTKTAEWNGTIDAQGFILNQDNIVEWSTTTKYAPGEIVKYKNKYWIALKVVQASTKFNELEWKETDYNEVQKGLLPNSQTRSYESTLYYDVDKANLENDADLLSFSLIGYRPRDYMALADLTDVTQVNVYKNMIKNKGTLNAASAFKGANLAQGGIDYDIYENWAIKTGEFGGVLNNNFVDLKLNETVLTNNPNIVALTNSNDIDGAQQNIQLYSIYNYGRPINNPNILATLPAETPNIVYPTAGYVNYGDVKMASYFYSGMPTATNQYGNLVSLQKLYVRDYVWLANYLQEWQVLTPTSLGPVIQAKNNLNSTVTITFANPHNLTKYQILALVNFDPTVDGYYVASTIVDPYKIIINLNLDPTVKSITGQGVGFQFQSQRVDTPADIGTLPLLNSEFSKNTVWVDTNTDGAWAVYQKNLNYVYDAEITKIESETFGNAVACNSDLGYLISDSSKGRVYRYRLNALTNVYDIQQVIPALDDPAQPTIGTAIAYSGNTVVISETSGNVYVYELIVDTLQDELVLSQTIAAPIGVSVWGQSVAISGDQNWLYVSTEDAEVYVYQLVSGTYQHVETLSVAGVVSADNFGYSIATNYYGDKVVIGTPDKNYSVDVENWGYTYVFDRTVQNIEVQYSTSEYIPQTFNMVWNSSATPLIVSRNGTVVDSADYTVGTSTVTMNIALTAGDIITLSGSNFVLTQTLTTGNTPRVGVQFGNSVDINTYGTEILVGAPFEINSDLQEGAVYRYTDGAGKYGQITGTTTCTVTTDRVILLNGFAVTLTAGDASHVAQLINSANITNVTAVANNGYLTIGLINVDLASANDKLSVSVLDATTLTELGMAVYTATQTIECPHGEGPTQFGTVVRFNEFGSFVASAPVGTRYVATTFDYTDDANNDNDTVFDNNATTWIDSFDNAGAVYMFDYLGVYNESLTNIGKFTYAQSLNAEDLDYGSEPMLGTALDFNNSQVIIGTPGFKPNDVNGQVISYINSSGTQDWSVYRSSAPVVDIDKIQNVQIYSASTYNTLENIDYLDPMQGKLLGAVVENVDYVSNADPAGYNVTGTIAGVVWGAEHVGQIWFDTSNVRFINYHQNDNTYNSRWWGRVFPGSDVAVYTWVESTVLPINYAGPGVPYDVNAYTTRFITTSSGALAPIYYFWARNTNIIASKLGKTLSDTIIQTYIARPTLSGIAYLAPILPNAFALYNTAEYVNNQDSVLHIGFGTSTNDDVSHSQYSLIRANYADDFLPGLPDGNTVEIPESLYDRMLDSLCGVDEDGGVVPNPYLPKPVQSGILARPRQSFFYNRFLALKNYLVFANEVLAQYPISEIRQASFLSRSGLFFNTADYWEYTNWWAAGYSDNTKAALQVPIYADLAALTVAAGTIVTVAENGVGASETYVLETDGSWTRIGLQNGTVQFKSSLWDYETARLGFGDNFFDTTDYDEYPSEETRYIVRALNEEIYIDDLQLYRNKSLILLFEYIQSETIENQSYLPWLNKTSFIDVSHTIRELRPIEVFQSDNQDFLAGYMNEIKPYHVVIKEFLFKYTGTDVFEGDITDFDLPATYDTTLDQYVTPQLVYKNPNTTNQFLPTDPVWQQQQYKQWFDNYGLTIAGQDNFQITTLASYIALNSNSFAVDNASGFPINGVVKLFDPADNSTNPRYELIGYANVDRATNVLSGLSRGINGTPVFAHIPGEEIYIDLPAVLLLNGGRNYTEPPKVTAYIDTSIYPEPSVPAQLEAVMSLDSVLSINVINPGKGYAVLPKIMIDPATTIAFNSSAVNTTYNTIVLYAPVLATGDIVEYNVGTDSTAIQGLVSGQHYYVNVLETVPSVVVALYTNARDAILDENRVEFYSAGTGPDHQFSLGAVASCISTSYPIRENKIALRFDRTAYTSQVTNWSPASFYGSFYAGAFNNTESVASSSITLFDTRPPINTILASAQGVGFEILDVEDVETVTWSSRTRNVVSTLADDRIYIDPSEGGSPVTSETGMDATIGFYVGMPVKFKGAVGTSGLVDDTVYYVKSLIDSNYLTLATDKTLSTTVNLNAYTVGAAGLLLYVGEVTDTTIVTIDYPGIINVTSTTATTNVLTAPLNVTGSGGTNGFYTGLALIFTGSVFGNVIANELYYVTSVIGDDNQQFTMSTSDSPIQINITEIISSDTIVCESTSNLNVNDPIVFNNMIIDDEYQTSFGGIQQNTIYYVQSILNGSQFKIATSINSGSVVSLTPVAANPDHTGCILTSQIDTVELSTATGSMIMNVNLPVSPGQISGQQFTLYETSKQYIGKTGTVGNQLTRTVDKTLAAPVSRVFLTESSGGILNVYDNMPVQVTTNIGNLIAGTTYNVTEFGATEIEVTNTSSSTNYLTTTDTSIIYENMPIIFSEQSLGGVLVGVTYYVKDIPTSTQFTISIIPGDSPLVLTEDNGIMVGTGEPYIKLGIDPGTADGPVTLEQVPSTDAEFSISTILGGYRAIITNPGVGYAVDNTITILGADIGGVTPTNNLVMTVASVDEDGGLVSVIRSGTPAGAVNDYYFKVVSENEVAVYSNALMTVPVPRSEFPYRGVLTTTVTAINGTTEALTVDSTSGFEIDDAVVFVGNVDGGINLGQVYYIVSLSPSLQVSEEPGGSPANLTTAASTNFTMTRYGDYALLPEPFYFNQSIVKYNNRVYRCIISNNDDEFIFGKWELLNSGDRALNAMDRAVGYYEPTINMPGLDLTQLFEGVTYPNSTYLGNAFAPDQEFTLDTVLKDQPFYPTEVDVRSIVWDGTRYLAPSNTPTYSANLLSIDGEEWTIDKISEQNINLTDILYAGGKYAITSNNSATPILVSDDGITWISNGAFTPWSAVPYDSTGYDMSSVLANSTSLNSITYNNGAYVAVGDNIIKSTDLYGWTETYPSTTGVYAHAFNGISYVNIPNFAGFVAVGYSQQYSDSNTNNVLLLSLTGDIWYSPTFVLANYALNAVSSDGTSILVVGDNSTRFISVNGSNWVNYSEAGTGNANLIDAIYANGIFVVVGDSGTIETSNDGASWTPQTSGTSENLKGITWNGDLSEFVVVGDNNTVLKSSDGITWVSSSLFTTDPTVYNVQGDAFTAGYGPEEIVPGVVSDAVTMIIATRPGTNWDATIYQHVGYNTVSLELTPIVEVQTVYSFLDVVRTPTQIRVAVIDGATNLSTTLIPDSDYTVNWIQEYVTLLTPIALSDKLRIDVYEPGNGNQLVKANTQTDPITYNESTGFQEIVVNCNYSAPLYSGSGVIRPGSNPIDSVATQTISTNNSIVCANISNFVLNSPVYFQGDVFGNIQEDTIYYVKTISYATGSITVSASYNVSSGTAGPTLDLTDDTGIMRVVIQLGAGTTWTDPIMYYNGQKLLSGAISTVTRTKSGANTITCNTTNTFIVGTTVTFSNTMFGNDIVPLTPYYISSIVDSNEFTISETLGGPTKVLSDATGGATLITNDYAFGIAPNGVSAKIVLAAEYDQYTDYLTYTLFGETSPQYGYTIPETQYFAGNGAQFVFNMTNFNGGDNPTNAIVEIDGVRLSESAYTISDVANTITLTEPVLSGSTLAVTTFNDTQRQYLNTQYGITGTPGSAFIELMVGETVDSEVPFDSTGFDSTGFTGFTSITVTAGDFEIGSQYQIVSLGTTDWNIVAGTTGIIYVVGDIITAVDPGTGNGTANSLSDGYYDEQLYWMELSSGSTADLNVNDKIIFTDPTIGGIIAGQPYYIAEILSDTVFTVSLQAGGTPLALTADTGAMEAVVNSLTVANITNISNNITAPITATSVTDVGGAGTNVLTTTSTINYVAGQTVIFKGVGFGNVLTDGTVYYIKDVLTVSTFTISATPDLATEFDTGVGTGNMMAYVGGQPAVRVTTGIPHNLSENTLIKIDGTLGSIQLNNNTYYAKIINTYQFDLYTEPYDPAYGVVNYPVTDISAYSSGGYVWRNGLFTLVTTNGTETSPTGYVDYITVDSTSELVRNTPVYFTEVGKLIGDTTLGGLIIGTMYFIKEIANATTFSVSLTRDGDVVSLTNETGTMGVTQWEQDNVDRLWVTINGLRVPSSSLRLNPANDLSILATIIPGDEVIITSMMPSATPNEEVFILNVNASNQGSAYRANTMTRTWLTEPLLNTDTTVHVYDATRLTNTHIQTETVLADVNGRYYIGLTEDKNIITQITVQNLTTGQTVPSLNYSIVIQDTAPVLEFTGGVSEGDSVVITVIVGNLVYVNGEQIIFGSVDLETNTLSQLQRGVNGTGINVLVPTYQEIYGILSENRMSDVDYQQVWNTDINPAYATDAVIPLQISDTTGAIFLNQDIT